MARRGKRVVDPDEQAFQDAWQVVSTHPMFRPLVGDPTASSLPCVRARWVDDAQLSRDRAWARVGPDGGIVANRHAKGSVEEWVWVLTHCVLHLGFGHLAPSAAGPAASAQWGNTAQQGNTAQRGDSAHRAACCLVVARFQDTLRLGRAPMFVPTELPNADEQALADRWRDTGVPAQYADLGVGGAAGDLAGEFRPPVGRPSAPGLSWSDRFAIGLSAAATNAVEQAGAVRRSGSDRPAPDSPWERARGWFVSSYPLLAGLAAGFAIVADRELAQQWSITIAAVDPGAAEIYINPLAALPEPQWRFVIAHEILHAALRHGERVGHRDPYLWNLATDYVINGWLVEMRVGELPDGLLHDPELAGLSSEAVYDRIVRDLRRYRKLSTLRGRGLGDVLAEPLPGRREAGRGVDLDEYYRRALSSGLAFHESTGRGLLPAGLVAEIRVLDHPPLPWDARLARWFDEFVPAAEKRRSYARPSRRQAASPGIPRPGWFWPEEMRERVTFGVVLDTSGSMNHTLLGKALGAIASYATAREVPAARVVFCDAAAYDAGYLPVSEIAGRVRVRGRGGTVLQPGIRLLERAEDFPATAPILIITDGYCDVVRVRREHAFLVPEAARLPFTPRGPVFRLR